jgi:hypothetical protein
VTVALALLVAVSFRGPSSIKDPTETGDKPRVLIKSAGDEEHVVDKWLTVDESEEFVGCIDRAKPVDNRTKWIVAYNEVELIVIGRSVRRLEFYEKDGRLIQFSTSDHKQYYRFSNDADAETADRLLAKYVPRNVEPQDNGLGKQ